ncbi:MAG: hypothetical protein WCD53_16410 [Microcoleus sp.]
MTNEQLALLTKLSDSGTEVKAIIESVEQTTRSIRVGKRAVNSVVPIKAGELATVSFMKVVPEKGEKLSTQDFEICIRIGGTRVCVSIDFDALTA